MNEKLINTKLAEEIIQQAEEEAVVVEKECTSSHYVNNEQLFKEMLVYKDQLKLYDTGKLTTRPRISEYIGSAILKIAERLSSRPNFAGYSYKDEMISDGIENAIMYLDNFDPEKSKNPFAYITQIIFYAFLRRIQKEKKQCFVKMKLFERADTTGALKDFIIKKYEIDPDKSNVYAEYFKLNDNDVNYFDTKSSKPKEKKKKERKKVDSPLNEFLG